jgi:hypothetical protein
MADGKWQSGKKQIAGIEEQLVFSDKVYTQEMHTQRI